MKQIVWLAILAAAGVLAYSLWTLRRRHLGRQRAAQERLTRFIAQTMPAPKPQPEPESPMQKLLLDAAAKAGEAGEAALSIQLYARLLARYPDSSLAGQARTAMEAQKKKLAKR